ncbi:MAG: hypothetical protein KBI40_03525 [Firmicutes bacterium]|mgnify:FL=1|jgi:hypothetical protein|nr:hypothetical protein [Candidatus Fermentithermobacillaceae bacterium]
MFMRKTLPTIIAFVCGITVIIAYFFNIPSVQSTAQNILKWQSVIAIFALGLGAINIIRVHVNNIKRDKGKNVYSIALLVTFAITIITGVFLGQDSSAYKFIFDYINVPTGSAIFSLLAFYIGTAAYRAFRAKNVEAAILLITGCIVMLGRVPLGAKILPVSVPATDWIMSVLNVGGQRGVMIAGAIGFIAVSLRIIIGLERRSYGGE